MTSARFRIFVSSPSDVFAERERLERVVARLNGEFGGQVLQAIRWESTYYSAAKTFQDQIPLPSETDLVICIFWKRLGFELPSDYRRADGTTPTGSEFEFEDAMQASRAKGTPDVLVYRKGAPVLLDAAQIKIEQAQFDALNLFWSRWFRSDAGHFTAAFHSFDTTDGFETAVEDHIRQWLARHNVASVGVTWPIDLRGSPFRGLEAFDASHAEVFFGRRRAIERARERLTEAAGRGSPFLLILGASGSGKSSLARAGLLPRLMQIGAVPGVDVWRCCVVRPGGGPCAALAEALYAADALPELAQGDNPLPADFAALMIATPEAAARAVRLALNRATTDLAAREQFGRPVEARLVLLIDQFEEALLDPGLEVFARALAALAASGTVWIVATLRSDLYGLFQASPTLLALREGGAQRDLVQPNLSELAEMLDGPAVAAGLSFDRDADGLGLDEVLTDAANQPGALPLLQLALEALFEARDRDANLLTFAAYDALGGLSGVIERRAEATLSGLDVPAQDALAGVLRALVDMTDDGVVHSRAVSAGSATRTAEAARLVGAFTAARLLILDGHGAESRLRVAHDALLSGWPRATALIAADREALRTRGRIAAAARVWLQEDRHDDFLLPHGRPLAEAVDLATHDPDSLEPDSLALVEASATAEAGRLQTAQAAAEHELRLEAQAQQARADAATSRVRYTRVAAAIVSVLLVLAAGAAYFANNERLQAQRKTIEAERNFTAVLGAGASMVDATNAHINDGGMSREVARSLLRVAEDNMGGLAQPSAGDAPKLRDIQARLLTSFSRVQLGLCDSVGAGVRAREAVAAAEQTATTAPSVARDLTLMRALNVLGWTAYVNNDRPAAIAAYRRAEQIAARTGISGDALAGDGLTGDALAGDVLAGDSSPGAVLRAIRTNLATALLRDDAASAVRLFNDDLAWQRQEVLTHPNDQVALGRQAYDLRQLASHALVVKQLPEAADLLGQEAAILARLSAAQPANMQWQLALAVNARQVSRLASAGGDATAALAQARTASQVAARLAAHDPGNGDWQREYVRAQTRLAQLLSTAGDNTGAIAAMRPALASIDALAGPAASSLGCLGDAAWLNEAMGLSLLLSDKPEASIVPLQANLKLIQGMAKAAPNDPERQEAVAHAHLRLGNTYTVSSHFDLAVGEYRTGMELLEPLLTAADAKPDWVDDLTQLSFNLGDVLDAVGQRTVEALGSYDAARVAADRIAMAQPAATQWQHVAIASRLRMAKADAKLARPDAQAATLREALDRAERLVAQDAKTPDWRGDLLETHWMLGRLDAGRGALPDALGHYGAALTLADGLAAEAPSDKRWRVARATLLDLLARTAGLNGQPAEAAEYQARANAARDVVNPHGNP